MEKVMRNKKFFLMIATFVLMLSGCNGEDLKKLKSSEIVESEEIEKAIEDQNAPLLKEYIKLETSNVEKDTSMLNKVQSSLMKIDKDDYLNFMRSWSKDLIKNRNYKDLNSLLDVSKDHVNFDEKNRIYKIIPEIKKVETVSLKTQEEYEKNIEILDKVNKDFKFDIYDIPANNTQYEFYGEVIQKIDANTYLVDHMIIGSKVERLVLKTNDVEFNKTGVILLNVVVLGTENYKTENGFTETFRVIHEIPEDKMELFKEVQTSVNFIENNKEVIELEVKNLESLKIELDNAIDALWVDYSDMANLEDSAQMELVDTNGQEKWEEGYVTEDWEEVLNNSLDKEIETELEIDFQTLTENVNLIAIERLGYNLFHPRSIAVYESKNENRYSGEAEKFFVLTNKSDVIKQIVYIDNLELKNLENERLLSLLYGITSDWSDQQLDSLFKDGEIITGGYRFEIFEGENAFKVDIRSEE